MSTASRRRVCQPRKCLISSLSTLQTTTLLIHPTDPARTIFDVNCTCGHDDFWRRARQYWRGPLQTMENGRLVGVPGPIGNAPWSPCVGKAHSVYKRPAAAQVSLKRPAASMALLKRPAATDAAWQVMCDKLQEWLNSHDGEYPSTTQPSGKKLAKWISKQRAERRTLLPSRITALESISGWRWAEYQPWEESFRDLRTFVERRNRHPSDHSSDDCERRLVYWL